MQHAEWLGNTTSLILISENDIYLRQSPGDEDDLRLTHTGLDGLIYNGVTDWLYQGLLTLGQTLPRSFILKLFSFLVSCRRDFQVATGSVGIGGRHAVSLCNI